MQIFTSRIALQSAITQHKQQGQRIGFIPTMGNLHAGHINLVTTAQQSCDWVITSIFVNPLQFAANEDLDNYPRTLEQDCEKLQRIKCNALFLPSVTEMYPSGLEQATRVSVPSITSRLCGASRPGHFDGVSTVVSKLFNIVNPNSAFFGEKDFQQLSIIRKMVIDLNYNIEIVGVPIVRADDNLALSSRNGYLSHTERKQAPLLYKALQTCKEALIRGDKNFRILEENAKKTLENKGFNLDYFEICNPQTLQLATANERQLVILAAASLGNTRLIDNVTLLLNC